MPKTKKKEECTKDTCPFYPLVAHKTWIGSTQFFNEMLEKHKQHTTLTDGIGLAEAWRRGYREGLTEGYAIAIKHFPLK